MPGLTAAQLATLKPWQQKMYSPQYSTLSADGRYYSFKPGMEEAFRNSLTPSELQEFRVSALSSGNATPANTTVPATSGAAAPQNFADFFKTYNRNADGGMSVANLNTIAKAFDAKYPGQNVAATIAKYNAPSTGYWDAASLGNIANAKWAGGAGTAAPTTTGPVTGPTTGGIFSNTVNEWIRGSLEREGAGWGSLAEAKASADKDFRSFLESLAPAGGTSLAMVYDAMIKAGKTPQQIRTALEPTLYAGMQQQATAPAPDAGESVLKQLMQGPGAVAAMFFGPMLLSQLGVPSLSDLLNPGGTPVTTGGTPYDFSVPEFPTNPATPTIPTLPGGEGTPYDFSNPEFPTNPSTTPPVVPPPPGGPGSPLMPPAVPPPNESGLTPVTPGDGTSPNFPADTPGGPTIPSIPGIPTIPSTPTTPTTPGAPGAPGGSLLERLLSGNLTADDLTKLASAGLGGLATYMGGKDQAEALKYATDKNWEMFNKLYDTERADRAPSRTRFETAMSPGFDPYTGIAGYKGAVDTTSESLLRRLSATGGNPYGNPGGMIEANKQIIAGTALPAIQDYTRQNASVGFNQNIAPAVGFGSNAIATGAQADASNPFAQTLGFLGGQMTPKTDWASLLRQFGMSPP